MANKFKVGMKVKLKTYTYYSDYISHKGQVAEIVKIFDKEEGRGFDMRIEWEDRQSSSVRTDNLIPLYKNWKERVEG